MPLRPLWEFLEHGKLADYAKGLRSPSDYGNLDQLAAGQLVDFYQQEHDARRAGRHYDVRFGTPSTGLFSWATRHELPGPGERRMLFQQPVHRFSYGNFQGTIPAGYGAGTVRQKDKGKLVINDISPGRISFTMVHKKYPERFLLLRPDGQEGKDWLLINTTPREGPGTEKVRYAKIPAQALEQRLQQWQQGDSLEAKVDGASSVLQILKHGVEVTSYRKNIHGRPIVHTERLYGHNPHVPVPPELVGTILKGEMYGQDSEGKVIPVQALGGLLNSSVAKSLEDRRRKGIQLRGMIYDVVRHGKQDINPQAVPRPERRKLMDQIVRDLPEQLRAPLSVSQAADTPDAAQQLWRRIQAGQHPMTTEGAVLWPELGNPTKIPLHEEADVYAREFQPSTEGKYKGQLGTLGYSLKPDGPVVGYVGTGFSDEARRQLWEDREQYAGRPLRLRAKEQLPSGAYRAPAFLAFHEG